MDLPPASSLGRASSLVMSLDPRIIKNKILDSFICQFVDHSSLLIFLNQLALGLLQMREFRQRGLEGAGSPTESINSLEIINF